VIDQRVRVDLTTDHPAADRRYEWGNRPTLTGLRLIAVYAVILFHADIGLFEGGFVGVDLFFVLSGFLVCQVLLSELIQDGRIRFARFYARRIRRLLPAAVVMIVTTSAAYIGVASLLERTAYIGDARSALLYVSNWHFLANTRDYFAISLNESPFLHFWSLSIEEQYYFIFPAVLVGLWVLIRRRSWTLVKKRTWAIPVMLFAIAVASLALQVVLNSDANRAYFGTDTRIYQILSGATFAAWLRLRGDRFRTDSRLAAMVAGASIVGFSLLCTNLIGTPSVSWRGLLAVVMSLLIIGALERTRTGAVSTLLSSRPAVYLGLVSYGTYLWHWPVLLILERAFAFTPWTLAVVGAIVSTALAALSRRFVEEPALRRGVLDRFPRQVVTAGLALSVSAAIWIVPTILSAEARPILGVGLSPTAASELKDSESVNGISPNAGDEIDPRSLDLLAAREGTTRNNCTDEPVSNCILRTGSNEHLMVIGDSHAAAWIPMLLEFAEEYDMTLSASTTGACPWQRDLVMVDGDKGQFDQCRAMITDVYSRVIPELDPDVLILAHRGWDQEKFLEGHEPLAMADGSTSPNPFQEAVSEDIDLFLDQGRRVVILEPLIESPFDQLLCLSGARLASECSFPFPEETLPSELFYREIADEFPGVVSLDLDPLVCPDRPVCAAVIDGSMVVRRDSHHITTAFSAHLGRAFAEVFLASGILEEWS
jgi:peptidoglycan/LPS O-acetylase OafA/YrhL